MSGPVPKRSDQRRRRNGGDAVEHAEGGATVTIPDPDPNWHDVAAQWFNSLAESGQSRFYESSDWAVAYVIAESMSRDLNEQVVGITDKGDVVKEEIPLKGASLSAYLRAMSLLLVTEGDRRRLRLELERPTPSEGGDGDVAWLDTARRRRSG